MNSYSDEQLMKTVAEGDVSKLGLIFERHNRQLYNFFYRLVHKGEMSEDLVQEVFCRILKYRHSYTVNQPFLPWFFRIAHNVANDHFRGEPKELPLAQDYDPPSELDAQRGLDQRFALKQLEHALQNLEPDKRELVILCRFHNLKYQQIAKILGCSVAAIKVRLHRALKELSLGYRREMKETVS